jgi:hypothetical protein
MTNAYDGLDENNWLLEKEINQSTTAILSSLSQMELEFSLHSQAVREFSQAFNMVLTAYRNRNIDYKTSHELIKNITFGFIDGVRAVQEADSNRKIRNAQRSAQRKQDGRSIDSSYRRNMKVNNDSFNIRFMASCVTSECLMRNANIDLNDDEFQSYIVAATKDKRSDIMQVIGVTLIVNPYLKVLENIVLADVVYSGVVESNFDPFSAYAMGKGASYRLRLLNLSKRVQDTAENAVSYMTGNFLGGH